MDAGGGRAREGPEAQGRGSGRGQAPKCRAPFFPVLPAAGAPDTTTWAPQRASPSAIHLPMPEQGWAAERRGAAGLHSKEGGRERGVA